MTRAAPASRKICATEPEMQHCGTASAEISTPAARAASRKALALRMDCPIYVDELVLKNSKVSSAFTEKNTNEQLRNWLEGLSDEDLGSRYKM